MCVHAQMEEAGIYQSVEIQYWRTWALELKLKTYMMRRRDWTTRRKKENIKDAKRIRKERTNIMRIEKDKKIIVNYTALCKHEHPVASSHPANRRNPFLRQQLTWRELNFTVIDSAGRFARTLTRHWSWYVTHSRCKIQFGGWSNYRPSERQSILSVRSFQGFR